METGKHTVGNRERRYEPYEYKRRIVQTTLCYVYWKQVIKNVLSDDDSTTEPHRTMIVNKKIYLR